MALVNGFHGAENDMNGKKRERRRRRWKWLSAFALIGQALREYMAAPLELPPRFRVALR